MDEAPSEILTDEEECPLLLTQKIMFGKWKMSIIWFLARYETMRFGELKKAFEDPALTQKMLTQHLRALENDLIVIRKVYDEVPLRVEYSLSEIGKKFIPVIDSMESWAEEYMNLRTTNK
ncbi:MAG TPA: helix-turn-helix domain-containing protein [Oscillospiraceae bacterium]|nr:helix-turn-helix domain-containing protein [Oscillospiraceae bacterium]